MARVRRHGRTWNGKSSRFIFGRRRSWWCAWFLPKPATIRRNDGLEMGPSDRKSPFSLQFWALDPKIHHSKYHLRLTVLMFTFCSSSSSTHGWNGGFPCAPYLILRTEKATIHPIPGFERVHGRILQEPNVIREYDYGWLWVVNGFWYLSGYHRSRGWRGVGIPQKIEK